MNYSYLPLAISNWNWMIKTYLRKLRRTRRRILDNTLCQVTDILTIILRTIPQHRELNRKIHHSPGMGMRCSCQVVLVSSIAFDRSIDRRKCFRYHCCIRRNNVARFSSRFGIQEYLHCVCWSQRKDIAFRRTASDWMIKTLPHAAHQNGSTDFCDYPSILLYTFWKMNDRDKRFLYRQSSCIQNDHASIRVARSSGAVDSRNSPCSGKVSKVRGVR